VDDLVYALFLVLTLALLAALTLPAPARTFANEAGLHLWLLGSGCLATILTGTMALADQPLPAAIFGSVAWLLVMPCVWLARSPQEADGWFEEDEDEGDDDGSPSPHNPSAPSMAGDRHGDLRPAGLTPAGAALWAPARAVTVAAAASAMPATAVADDIPLAAPALTPAQMHPRRLRQRPRRVRADHRSIVHLRAEGRAHAGRSRRATLRLRLLRRLERRRAERV